jgi:class 3 adenylate cyclase/predicted ATPase
VSEVRKWLAGIGLVQYADAFEANEIDMNLLRQVDDQMLKDIGVSVGGHRLRIRGAIAKLTTSSPSESIAPAKSELQATSAERRQLTVMFCDLVGSTALSARLDPEDMREIIGAYHRCCAEHITKVGGFVAKYMGDGVLAYFGYPQAHEDDAERAVRCALALNDEIHALRTRHNASLQVRIGIATGLVVVGDLIGEGAAQEQAVVGDTPNVAARLQALAEPGQITISDSTRRLIGGMFEYSDLGRVNLKGLADAVKVWHVIGTVAVESRFEALHASGLTALVGREEECELLLRRWSKAKAGEGQVVLLSGEPGIGKSRLTAVLLERLATELHTRLRYFCSPQRTDSALYPIINHMERAAGLTHDDATQAKLDKLDALLAQTSTTAQDTALFAEMLSLPNDGRYPVFEFTPQQRRQKTLEALISQLEGLTRQAPVLMIFEDAHWTDPTSLEAFGRVVDRIRTLRALLIVTFRPEFDAPWIGRPYVTFLAINRLAQRDISAMIDGVAGNRVLPASLRQDIVERTDGIPLFVEEMTKAVLEAEGEGEALRTAAAVPAPAPAVPASLHASLMARLDHLGPAKDVAQIGAAIGREFSHSLLAAVVCKSEAELESALDRLIAAGLLFRQGVPPHAGYLFKHALVQDAAYSTLLREPRRALHARIAQILESQFVDIAENEPELLARHFTEAGLIEKAARLWGKAGQRSLERSALVEAVAQLTRALEQIGTLATTPSLRREQIKLQVALIHPLLHIKGYAAPETKAAAERARLLIEEAEGLGEPPDDPLLLFSVLYSFHAANLVTFNGDAICELATQFLALAEQKKTTAPMMIGHRLMGMSLLHTGEIAKGRGHFDRAIALYDSVEHRPLATRFGHDPLVAILCFRSLALWSLGSAEAALKDTEDALRRAREIGQAATLLYALTIISFTQFRCGNYAIANAQLDEVGALAGEKGASFWKAWGIMQRGCVLALTGKPSDVVQTITSGITAWRSTGSTLWLPVYLSYLASAYAELGRVGEASCYIGEAMTAIDATKERWFEAEVNRFAGDIALLSPTPAASKAESCFQRALAVARKQEAKAWELRAASSLARLWRDQGKRAEARDLLAPIYGWFTEGFDTPDLKEAKRLLDDLSDTPIQANSTPAGGGT